MSHERELYKIPGQHVEDGLIFGERTSRSVLNSIKQDLVLNKDDVLSVSYPKTGSSWVNEILFLSMCNADEGRIAGVNREDKYPFLEMGGYEKASKLTSPKLVKSHLPIRYFSRALHIDGPKIILITRNPKDTLVSEYHFYRANKGLGNFTGSWDEFFELHRHSALVYEDMFKYNVDWLSGKHDNLLLVKYEDMHKDTEGQIRRITKFIGKDFNDEQIQTIMRLSTFSALKENEMKDTRMAKVIDKSISPFFRKGKVGDWKNYFTAEQSAYMDDQYEEMYKPINLQFEFE